MTLSTGAQIGPYIVGDEIGSGGMGVVYRATDQNLKRDVAIKALPESLASDAERLARFQREAEVLASLNHPNIAQIYGLEKADGTTALVMELVEGPTLADRIAKGPVPPDEALGIAMQVADALEAAHSRNIVHRDLKPANIKLRPDGTVKVLDFGIAKALEPDSIRTAPQSPMLTTPATQVGVILGTAAYMSPEQAKGQLVDQRADIWAFGCVLYEMLTGQLAFGAEDVPTTLARVIDRDTDMDSLPGAISSAVRHTIQLCLQKDVRKRVADIRDVRLALEGAFETYPRRSITADRETTQPIWRRMLPLGAALASGVLITGFASWYAMRPLPSQVTRFSYDFPESQSLRGPGWPLLAISPDGRRFVYNTQEGLYLRRMDRLEAQLIAGTEPALDNPVFSPDGLSVAYWDVSNQLKRISITGGAPVSLTFIAGLRGISWQADGTILYAQQDSIFRVPATGGTSPESIVPMLEDDYNHGAQLLPDGDTVLFSIGTSQSWDEAQIVAQSISTGDRTVLIEGGNDARYLPTGHIVYALGDALFVVAFDPDTLTVSGGAIPVVQGVMRSVTGQTGAAHYDVSDNGTLVYLSGDLAATTSTLVWVDRDGKEEPIAAEPRNYTTPRISPDGTKALVNARDRDQDIWIWDFSRETLTRLTFDRGQDRFPIWSPDGLRVAYHSVPTDGGQGVFWRAADGTGSVEPLAEGNQLWPASFLPDGSALVVYGSFAGAGSDNIGLLRLNDERNVEPLLNSDYTEETPDVSPDGKWLAYASDESGTNEIYVRAFPDVDDGGRWQVSTNGGSQPLWSQDGRELFFRNEDAMMAVQVTTEPTFTPGNPVVLFEGSYSQPQGGRTYDVSSDGDRFLMMKDAVTSSGSLQFIIVENWFEEINRLAPTE